jgi:serine/threonine protein kinase
VDGSDNVTHFALKRFFNRDERDDFANESNILRALSRRPHEHIAQAVSSWTSSQTSYILFPLADGDLYHFFRTPPPSELNKEFSIWILQQAGGVCDAIKYIHNYEFEESDLSTAKTKMRRIGFHHDLKPANILLYGAEGKRPTWKIGDFGSGAVKDVAVNSRECLYNRKASTGDPVYSAPEYVVDGRVSYPKDIWSLGCIYLEILVWALDQLGGLSRFEQARLEFSQDCPDHAPTFWCQKNGGPYLNPAVDRKLSCLELRCKATGFFAEFLSITRQMLAVDPVHRLTAPQVCAQFERMLQGHQTA